MIYIDGLQIPILAGSTEEAYRAFAGLMMAMRKIDIARIEAARAGETIDA